MNFIQHTKEAAASQARVDQYLKYNPHLRAPEVYRERANLNTQRVAAMPESLRVARSANFDKCEAEAHCRMCLRHMKVRPLTRHHLVPLRWWKNIGLEWRGVRNCPNNIIPMCRACHDLVESSDEEIRQEARRMCRRAMTQIEIAFAIATRGKEWFNHHYPA